MKSKIIIIACMCSLFITGAAPYNKEYDLNKQCYTYNLSVEQKFKSYMDYKTITDKTSDQYMLQKYAVTSYKGMRCLNERYLIAIGTGFNARIGQYVDIVLDNGYVIPCIVGDIKADKDTDEYNISNTVNGCCTEFIIDNDVLNKCAAKSGDMSSIYSWWNYSINSINILNECVNLEEL